MKTLIEKLKEFNYQQIDKFVKRIYKHQDNSVTDDTQFSSAIGNTNQARENLELHLIDEVLEYFRINYQDRIEIRDIIVSKSNGYDKKETIDIANLAFLLWCFDT